MIFRVIVLRFDFPTISRLSHFPPTDSVLKTVYDKRMTLSVLAIRRVWGNITSHCANVIYLSYVSIHVQYSRKHTDGKDYLPSVIYIFVSWTPAEHG